MQNIHTHIINISIELIFWVYSMWMCVQHQAPWSVTQFELFKTKEKNAVENQIWIMLPFVWIQIHTYLQAHSVCLDPFILLLRKEKRSNGEKTHEECKNTA